METKINLTILLANLLELFFPHRCLCCGKLLMANENFLCLACLSNLPVTSYHRTRGNRLEALLSEKIPVARAATFALFSKGGNIQKIIHALKYKRNPELGVFLGKLCAMPLVQESSFMAGVDVLVPVPLHPKREKARGYNQALQIASGISAATGIPLLSGYLIRAVYNKSQVMQPFYEREANTEDIFRVVDFQAFEGKHILLIDDVITSGSTVISCAKAILKEAVNVKISIYSICAALG